MTRTRVTWGKRGGHMVRSLSQAAVGAALVGLGWGIGQAEFSAPDFSIRIDAPVGQTKIECVRGCNLQGSRDEGNPNNQPVPTYFYQCSGKGIARCVATVNGWTSRKP